MKISEDGYHVAFSSLEESHSGYMGAARVFKWNSECGTSSTECCVDVS